MIIPRCTSSLAHRAPRIFVALMLGLMGLGMASSHLGWDMALAYRFYDVHSAAFPARASWVLEQWGHRGARGVLEAGWLLGVATALVAGRWARLKPYRALLWTTLAAMMLGPLTVSALKSLSTPVCPWDLPAFGGQAPVSERFWAWGAPAGHCFPSGHAAAGFSLIALYWAGRACARPWLARLGLVLAAVVGSSLGLLRMMQGAHFLSHTLWSAALDGLCAWGVFWAAERFFPSAAGRATHHHDKPAS